MKHSSRKTQVITIVRESTIKVVMPYIVPFVLLAVVLVPSIAFYQPDTSTKQFSPMESKWEYLPDYPNSNEVKTTRTGKGYSFDGKPYATMTFITLDPPATVFEFYKEVFRKRTNPNERWRLDRAKQDAATLEFFGFGPEERGGAIYTISIKTQQIEGQTIVTVERTLEGGF